MKQFFGKKSRSALVMVLVVSAGLHVAAIVIFGTIKFVSAALREETVLEAPPIAPPPQKEPEYTVNIKQRNESTPPPRPPAIVVNNPSELDIPALDIDVNIDSSSVYGRGGGGFGGGLAGMREMAVGDLKLTDFGYTGAAPGTLEGTLIDMKRDKEGKPITVGRVGAIREFTDGSWKLSRLTDKFYSAEQKLYASYWMIPKGSAARAPQSFGVEGEIEATGIIAYYDGSFTPDETMDMRFVGIGDDVLIVRLNSNIVFDGSWTGSYSDAEMNVDGPKVGRIPQLRTGKWQRLRAGKTYDLKVLIAEIPGGGFMSYLFYQLKGDDKLRIFSTNPLSEEEKKVLREKGGVIAQAVE